MTATTQLPRASHGLGYYEFERPEVIAMIPGHARRVLDFGCASGACGARIKRERGAEVVGVELLPGPAEVARTRLDRVIVGDCESMDFAEHFQPGEFDAVLFADVLEHLRDPQGVLERIKPYLAPGGVVVASIPNVRNWAVVSMLGRGDWTYEEAGLMDRTHIHFFTRREIQRTFSRGGYTLDALSFVKDPQYATWEKAGRPVAVQLDGFVVQPLNAAEVEELFVYQFLVRARVADPLPFADGDRPLTSIVIPVRNQSQLTKLCVESIRANTPGPLELILVDNGSSDDTPEWARAQADVTYIRNDVNRGFAAACNQGIAAAGGAYVVLLNNDTAVPAGWLDGLLAPMAADPGIGLTGPRTNEITGPQRCSEASVYGKDMATMQRFAADWQLRHRGTGFRLNRLVGFCLAIRREVIDRIGGLDERFGTGNFEDDDYLLRAAKAGYRAWVANDSFVHHWGSQTFVGEKIEYGAQLRRNWVIFARKWGLEGVNESDELPGLYDFEAMAAAPNDDALLYCPLPEAPRPVLRQAATLGAATLPSRFANAR